MKRQILCVCLCLVCLMWMISSAALAEEEYALTKHGDVSWYELMTTDVEAATQFYTQLFGWKTEEDQTGDGARYIIIEANGKKVGGIMKIPPQAQGAPPNWGMYVTVDDIEATVKKAQELGATIIVPPVDIPGEAKFSVFQDPQGAVISIISYYKQKK